MTDKNCENCKWMNQVNIAPHLEEGYCDSTCHRYPPLHDGFPKTCGHYWCGEWAEKGTHKAVTFLQRLKYTEP